MTYAVRRLGQQKSIRNRTFACVAISAIATAFCEPSTAAAEEVNTSSNAGDGRLGEIVVTATRRSEAVTKVAASIAAYDRSVMDQQGIRNFTDIVAQTPGLSLVLPSTFQPANIAIRGVRSVVGAATTGIYIDDTPIQLRNISAQDPGDALPYIFDLDRVEVLRGPQGTLFGSGSEGGAVRFISPAPSLESTNFYSRAELSSTQSGGLSYEGGVAMSAPIVEGKVGARLSASYRHSSGFIDRIDERTGALIDKNVNTSNIHTMKAALLFAPNDTLRVTPSVNFQETRNHDASQYYVRLSDPSDQELVSGSTLRQPTKDRFYLPAMKVESDFGSVTATSVSSYFGRRQSGIQDFSIVDDGVVRLFNTDSATFQPINPALPALPITPLLPAAFVAEGGSATVIHNRQDNYTQEIRLQSNDTSSAFSWLVGGFFQRNTQRNNIHVDDPYYAAAFQGLLGSPNINGVSNYTLDFMTRDKQIAGFANFDYRIGTVKLSAGGRIASTEFSFRQVLDGPLNGGHQVNVGKQKESPFTPKVSLTWEPDNDALLYAAASKGFRVGGANTPVAGSPPCQAGLAGLGLTATPSTYKSDSVWNYEVGGKFRLLDRRVQVNASAYHVDWSNIQSFISLSGCATGFVANLGSANSDGFDLAINARPTQSLFLSLSGGYNKSTFQETVVKGGVVLSEKGAIVSDAPPWQITATIEYSQPVGRGDGYVRAIDQYASKNKGNYSKFDNPLASGFDPNGQRNEAFHLASLRAGWRDETFDFSFFVDNLFNAHPQLNHTYSALPTDTTYFANTLRPRTVGVTFTARR